MTYNRSQIMKEANRLHRLGMPRAAAMRAAWASAKASLQHHGEKSDSSLHDNAIPRTQQAGLKAAMKRYGIDADRIALRAQEAVKAIIAAIADIPALLPPPVDAGAIELKRGTDGVYRL